MEIKKADSKGRVTVGEDGKVYSVQHHNDGAITLHPVDIPEHPVPDFDYTKDMRAIYWSPGAHAHRPETITIYSILGGSLKANAEQVAKWANDLMIPVVINPSGYGSASADFLRGKVDRGVIEKMGRW